MNTIDAVTGNQQDGEENNLKELDTEVDGDALKKAEDLLKQVALAKQEFASQPEELDRRLEELAHEASTDPDLAELVAEAGAKSNDSEVEVAEAGKSSVVEQINKTVAACTSLEGVATFLKYYMVPPDTLVRLDEKEIANYLQKSYPNLLSELQTRGLDVTPTDGNSRSNFQEWVKRLRSEKGSTLTLSDFTLPDMPEGMRVRMQELLKPVIESFVTKAKDYLTSRARNSEGRLLDSIGDALGPIDRVKKVEAESIAPDKQRLRLSPWLTVEEVDTAYTQHDEYLKIFDRITGELSTQLPTISDDVLASTETKKGFADRYIQDDAELQSHPDLSRAMSFFILNLLRSESGDRKKREAEKRQQEQQILNLYTWSIVSYSSRQDPYTRKMIDAMGRIEFGIAEKGLRPSYESQIFNAQPIYRTQGTGIGVLSNNSSEGLQVALKPVIEALIVKRHGEAVKLGKRRINEASIAIDVHAYLQGVNDGYVDQSSPTDTSETYLDGFAKGQSLKSSVA